MLLKKSSTLTAEADDLAERSAPMGAVTVDETKARAAEGGTDSLRFREACAAFLARSSSFRCRSIAVKVDSLRARTEADSELSKDAVVATDGVVVETDPTNGVQQPS
jgi:hypothetical protein